MNKKNQPQRSWFFIGGADGIRNLSYISIRIGLYHHPFWVSDANVVIKKTLLHH